MPRCSLLMQDDELFKQTVTAYEERINEIVSENNELRKSLKNLQQELQVCWALI